jgi:hypothetical protein
MAWNSRFLIVSLLVIASCSSESSPDADDLIGTWDYPLDQMQSQLAVDGFAAEGFAGVESAEEVVIRLGFDGSEFWQGFLFDDELFLLDGVPEGDGGPYEIDGDQIIMTGGHGTGRGTFTWDIDDDELTLEWVEGCSLSPPPEDCTTDRSRVETEDPFMLMVMEHTFTKSGDDPSY